MKKIHVFQFIYVYILIYKFFKYFYTRFNHFIVILFLLHTTRGLIRFSGIIFDNYFRKCLKDIYTAYFRNDKI